MTDSTSARLRRLTLSKLAFQPPAPPPGGDPMAGGGMPPMDPAMMGMPPMGDPMAGGGMPPMDPAAMGGMPLPPPPGSDPMAGGMPPDMMGGLPPPPPDEGEGEGEGGLDEDKLAAAVEKGVRAAMGGEGAGDMGGGDGDIDSRVAAIEEKVDRIADDIGAKDEGKRGLSALLNEDQVAPPQPASPAETAEAGVPRQASEKHYSVTGDPELEKLGRLYYESGNPTEKRRLAAALDAIYG